MQPRSARDESGRLVADGETHVEILDPTAPTCPQSQLRLQHRLARDEARQRHFFDEHQRFWRFSWTGACGVVGGRVAANKAPSQGLPAFLNKNELVAWMHGEFVEERSIMDLDLEELMTPKSSPKKCRSSLPGNPSDALPLHRFWGEAETQSGTTPFEEEQQDQRRQEDSVEPSPCQSACGNGSNDSPKEPPDPAPCHKAEMRDDEEDLPGALRAAAGEGTSSSIEMSLPTTRQAKAFLNKNEIVARMHGESIMDLDLEEHMTPKSSPTKCRSSLPGNPSDALPLHRFWGEAETQSGTTPFEEEQQDQRRQEDSVEPSPCQSACGNGSNDSPKEPREPAPCHKACSSETEMNDDEEDLPGALRAAAGEGTSSSIEMPDPIDASKSASDAEKDPADLFHPACDVLPALLEYFSVPDILAWRVTSKQTRSPEVLLRHVAELGRFDTSASIIAFSDAVTRTTSPDSEQFPDEFPDDVECQKRFDCQLWCVMLARSDSTHFAEDYVRQTVDNNLTVLFSHCLDSDERVRVSAHYIVLQHSVHGLGFVKELITDTLLSQMRDILTGTEIEATWKRIKMYMPHLDSLLRSLTQHQHREWMSLLVNVLRRLQSASARHRAARQNLVIDRLKLLWLAAGDPNRTYADEKRQLRAMADSLNVGDRDDQKTKLNLQSLLHC
ncbi:AMT1-1 [Symbiodinium sp. CCMP2592]|nr:AMT1-1 [Symbiodinium sp. CCMP2592]